MHKGVRSKTCIDFGFCLVLGLVCADLVHGHCKVENDGNTVHIRK